MCFMNTIILCLNYKNKNINLNLYIIKLIYVPLFFIPLFIFISPSLWLDCLISFFLCIDFCLLGFFTLKMDMFGFKGSSNSGGPQGGEGSSGSGQNPNNNKRPFEASDSDRDRDRNNKIFKSTPTQATITEDTLVNAKREIVSARDKREAINDIYYRLKLTYPNMNFQEKKQFISSFQLGLYHWNKGYHTLTVKDMATLKKGFVEYPWLLSDKSKDLLGDMATDSPLMHSIGYQAEFFRSRDPSEKTRKEADEILFLFEFDHIIYPALSKDDK